MNTPTKNFHYEKWLRQVFAGLSAVALVILFFTVYLFSRFNNLQGTGPKSTTLAQMTSAAKP